MFASNASQQFKMKRNPRKLAWTKSFRRAHGKELTVDSTLAFAARRNVPVRYNRDLVATTLKAMQRVSEIRAKRERKFYKDRMRGNKARQLAADRELVEKNQHLLPPEEREVIPEHVRAKMEARRAEEEVMDMAEDVEEMRVEDELRAKPTKAKLDKKKKQRLIRGQGPEAMEVDS